MQNPDEIGDGLLFHNAVKRSRLKTDELLSLMSISNGKLFGLYKKETFTLAEKQLAAKALGKTVEDIFTSTPVVEKGKKRIPVMGDAVAGTGMEMNVMEDSNYVAEYIDIGDMLKDSEAAFTVYGNSMTPAYPPGCLVGVKLNCDKFIQPGETYLVLTKSNRVFKRLYNTDDGNGFVCFSDNTMKHDNGPLEGRYHYPTFVIPKEDIISIFDVTGMIKRNRNSSIIQRQI